MHDGIHETAPDTGVDPNGNLKTFPPYGKMNSPAVTLTAWQKLEAVEARCKGDWEHPSLIASGLVLPNLRDNIAQIMKITTKGVGEETNPPVPPGPNYTPAPLADMNLSKSVKTRLTGMGITAFTSTTDYRFLVRNLGCTATTADKILAERDRILGLLPPTYDPPQQL